MRFKTGFLLGKFMPPSIGHMHLAGFSYNIVDNLTIVVETRDSDPVPGHLRVLWMQEMFPKANVFRLHKEMPQSPDEHPDFWNYWKSVLMPFMYNKKPDIVFASDDYGHPLAECLGGRFFPVDPGREVIKISATKIRNNPEQYWDYISYPAREYYAKKIAFIGPESTGKSTLIQTLSEKLNTIYVREFASLLLKYKNDFVFEDTIDAAIAQQADIKYSSRLCNKLLFVDSDTLTTKVWSETLFNKVDPVVNSIVEKEEYNHTFLFYPDTPYVMDEHRNLEWVKFRMEMFKKMEYYLKELNRPYTIVSGNWQEREELVKKQLVLI